MLYNKNFVIFPLQFDRNKMVEEYFYRVETIQYHHSELNTKFQMILNHFLLK